MTGLDATRPQRRALADDVYETVKALIMDQRIAPGERINIDRLARELEVSPTPLREALARLEADGLATKRALVGYSAAPLLNVDALSEVFELRLLVEPHCAARAADTASADTVAELAAMLEGFPQAGPGEDYRAYGAVAAADAAFHDLIARAAGRPLIADSVGRLHFHMHLFRLWYRRGVDRPVHAEHVRILRAIRRGDPDAAAAAMTTHLLRSWRRVAPDGADPLTVERPGAVRR